MEQSEKCDITGTHVRVIVNVQEEDEHMHEYYHEHQHEHEHEHEHEHHHHHHHNSMHGIEHIVNDHLKVSDKIKKDILVNTVATT